MPPLAVRTIGVAGWPCFCSPASPSGPSTSRTRTPETGPVTMPTPDQDQAPSSSCVALRVRYGRSSCRLGSLEPGLIGMGDHPRRRYSTASPLAAALIQCAPRFHRVPLINLLSMGVTDLAGAVGAPAVSCLQADSLRGGVSAPVSFSR